MGFEDRIEEAVEDERARAREVMAALVQKLDDLQRNHDRLQRLLSQVMEERLKWSEPQPLPDRLAKEIRTVLRGEEPPRGSAKRTTPSAIDVAEEARVSDGKDNWIALARTMIVSMAANEAHADRLLGMLAHESGHAPCQDRPQPVQRTGPPYTDVLAAVVSTALDALRSNTAHRFRRVLGEASAQGMQHPRTSGSSPTG